MMKEDPGASKKRVIAQVKAKIHSKDTAARLAHTTSLPGQGLNVWEFEGRVAQNSKTAISTLPDWCFKFALNAATDTLPHYAREPLQVEEAVLTIVPALGGVPISGPYPKLLPEGPCPQVLHLKVR